MLLEQIKFIEQQVTDTEKEIKLLMEKIASPITSITGIGPAPGAVILGELGDFSRFESAKSLVSFAGIDASVSQSGQYESTTNHMSKRVSPYLRRAYTWRPPSQQSTIQLFAHFTRRNGRRVSTTAFVSALSHASFAISFTRFSRRIVHT
jgi:transposase